LREILAHQRILELVREMAELAKTASGCVTFERVNSATEAAQGFEVVRAFFQAQGLFVHRLEDFLGALEEDLAQFRASVAGERTHGRSSTRR
jgi:hypothetical protein